MTATWVTIVVAVLTAVVGLGGALGGQALASSRAVRLEEFKRAAERADQDRQERRAAYVRFLAAARSVGAAASTVDRGRSDSALARLREAGADLELANAGLWEERAVAVVDAAARWVAAALREGPTAAAARDAEVGFASAVEAVRERMLADLDRR